MSRIGAGPTPFGQGGVALDLASGQVFYPPPGNYILRLGAQTVLQVFDGVQLAWRNAGRPNATPFFVSVDGYNFRLANLSGVAIGTSITNAGSGATNGIGAAATGVAVSFGSAPSNGQAAAAYPIVGGAINSTITITNGGSGFTVAPTLFFDPPPPGGIQAEARCTISAGVINAVTVDNAGAGYTAAPNCYVVPQFATYQGVGVPVNTTIPVSAVPPGLIGGPQPPFLPNIQWQQAPSGGAVLTVNSTLAGSGTLTGLVMTQYGAGYTGTTIPTITITGAGAAAATAIMSMCVTSVTVSNAGAAVSVAPIWQSSFGLIGAILNNGGFQPRPASGTTTLSTTTVGTIVVEDPGFGLQSVPVIGFMPAGGTAWTTNPAGTAVCGGTSDRSFLQPAVE